VGRQLPLSLRLASTNVLWQPHAMIEFRTHPDNHPDLAHSPLLRGALLTLQYAQEHGAIGLTKNLAFKTRFCSLGGRAL
jgi:hypothetical protein